MRPHLWETLTVSQRRFGVSGGPVPYFSKMSRLYVFGVFTSLASLRLSKDTKDAQRRACRFPDAECRTFSRTTHSVCKCRSSTRVSAFSFWGVWCTTYILSSVAATHANLSPHQDRERIMQCGYYSYLNTFLLYLPWQPNCHGMFLRCSRWW